MQISDDPTLNLLEKLKGDLDKQSRDCRFHHDHGHNTSKCYELKSQIIALIRKGKLQRFIRGGPRIQPLQGLEQLGKAEEWSRAPLGEIRMIIGGIARLMAERKSDLEHPLKTKD